MSESNIQRAICDYLAYRKHFFWRQNTGGMYREGRFFSLPKYSMSGLPDIIIIKDGFFIGLEVKTPKTKQNKNQKEFERLCKEAGGEYYVVRDVSELKELGL